MNYDCGSPEPDNWLVSLYTLSSDSGNHIPTGPITSKYSSEAGQCLIASCLGNILTIYCPSRNADMQEDSGVIELEFDFPLTALCWSSEGSCLTLIVGDNYGNVYFVSPEGRLLVSHSVKANNRIIDVNVKSETSQSTLSVLFLSGDVVVFDKFSFAFVCNLAVKSPHYIAAATQKLSSQTFILSTPSTVVKGNIFFRKDSLCVSVLTQTKQFCIWEMNYATRCFEIIKKSVELNLEAIDYVILSNPVVSTSALVAFLRKTSVVIVELESVDIVLSISVPPSMETISLFQSLFYSMPKGVNAAFLTLQSINDVPEFKRFLIIYDKISSIFSIDLGDSNSYTCLENHYCNYHEENYPVFNVFLNNVWFAGTFSNSLMSFIQGVFQGCQLSISSLGNLDSGLYNDGSLSILGLMIGLIAQNGQTVSRNESVASQLNDLVYRVLSLLSNCNQISCILDIIASSTSQPESAFKRIVTYALSIIDKFLIYCPLDERSNAIRISKEWHSRMDIASSLHMINVDLSFTNVVSSLSSSQIFSTFLSSLQQGKLPICSRIIKFRGPRLMKSVIDSDIRLTLVKLMTEIDQEVELDDIVSFLSADWIPFISKSSQMMLCLSDVLEFGDVFMRYIKKRLGRSNPLKCISAVKFCISLLQPHDMDKRIKEMIASFTILDYNLSLQANIWLNWNDNYDINDIEEIGLDGLVFDKLSRMQELSLPQSLVTIRETVAKFSRTDKDVSCDRIFLSWINDVIDNQILDTNNLNQSNDDIDAPYTPEKRGSIPSSSPGSGGISLSRLIIVALSMVDVPSQSSAITKLMQISSIVEGSNLYQLTEPLISQAEKNVSSNKLDKTTIDSLNEIIRLYRIRRIANTYGIINLDPCDSRQMKFAVNYIACHTSDSGIKDAVTIISAWNIKGLSVCNVLSRALCTKIRRLSDLDFDAVISFTEIFSLVSCEQLTVLAEDVVRCMIGVVEEMFTQFKLSYFLGGHYKRIGISAPVEMSLTEDIEFNEENVKNYRSILHGIIQLVSQYLDALKLHKDINKHSTFITGSLLSDLRRMRSLDNDHGIVMPLSSLNSSKIGNSILSDIAKAKCNQMYTQSDSIDVVSSRIVKICALLNIPTSIYVENIEKILLQEGRKDLALQVMKDLVKNIEIHGLFDKFIDKRSHSNGLAYIEISKLVCSKQISLKTSSRSVNQLGVQSSKSSSFSAEPFHLSKDLLIRVILECSDSNLPDSIDMLSCCDLYLSVMDRTDQSDLLKLRSFDKPISLNLGKSLITDKENIDRNNQLGLEGHLKTATDVFTNPQYQKLSAFVISESNYTKDGVLLDQQVIINPLLKFIFQELQQRKSLSGLTPLLKKQSLQGADVCFELSTLLQKSESHVLASRVLLSSWVDSTDSSNNKALALKTSLQALTKKILTYREIDIPFAINCLSCLPYDNMVRELKTTIPSIQSDFSRLNIVSRIGEELARLWDQDQLLIIFQGLQINAEWWEVLSSRGIAIDAKTFQSSDVALREQCIRGMVPKLLSVLNESESLEKVVEYCRQFDIEPSFAYESFIEQLLVNINHEFTAVGQSWVERCRDVLHNRLEIGPAISCLRRILRSINEFSYEKIYFVCEWLLNAATTEDATDGIMEDLNDGIAVYQQYMDVVNCLLSITSISKSDRQSPQLSRLPFWSLVDNPWTVLMPILETSNALDSSNSIKLSALCGVLGVDKDIFHTKRILATYSSKISILIQSPTIIASVEDAATMKYLSEDIDLYLRNPRSKVGVWCDIATYVSSQVVVNNKWSIDLCVSAINQAIRSIEQYVQYHGNDDDLSATFSRFTILRFQYQTIANYSDLEQSVSLLLGNSSAEFISDDSASITQKLMNNEPLTDIVCDVFHQFVKISWQLHVGSHSNESLPTTTTSKILNVFDLVFTSQHGLQVTPDSVSQVSNLFKDFLHDLSIASQKLCNSQNNTKVTLSRDDIELIRHGMIGRLLTDVDHSNEAQSNPNANSKGNSHTNRSQGLSTASLLQDSSSSFYVKSDAEYRREEDFGIGYSIAVLVLGCLNEPEGQEPDHVGPMTITGYICQLIAVMKGRGFRSSHSQTSTRRLTGRSQLRAAIALHFIKHTFIANTHTYADKPIISYLNQEDDRFLIVYLSVLAEMNELRLSCTPQTLLEALGFQAMVLPVPNSLIDTLKTATAKSILLEDILVVRKVKTSNVQTLIKTWIQDEASIGSVLELCRDLLLFVNFINLSNVLSMDFRKECALWTEVLSHMHSNGFNRQIFQSICHVAKYLSSIRDGQVTSLAEEIFCNLSSSLEPIWVILMKSITSKVDEILERVESHGGETKFISIGHSSCAVLTYRVYKPCNYLSWSWEHPPEDVVQSLSQAAKLYSDIQGCTSNSSQLEDFVGLLIQKLLNAGNKALHPLQYSMYTVEAAVRRACKFAGMRLLSSGLQQLVSSATFDEEAFGRSFATMAMASVVDACVNSESLVMSTNTSDCTNSSSYLVWELFEELARHVCVLSPTSQTSAVEKILFSKKVNESIFIERTEANLKLRFSILLRNAAAMWNDGRSGRGATELLVRWVISSLTSSELSRAAIAEVWRKQDKESSKAIKKAVEYLATCFSLEEKRALTTVLTLHE